MTISRALTRTPKVLGADVELGNFILGDEAPCGTGAAASRRLLDEVRGAVSGLVPAPASNHPGWNGRPDVNPQDIGRRFLPTNGGCVYIDMDHLEVALPETTTAHDHVAHWRAMLLLAREAAACANRRLRDGLHIEVVANNSDGLGHSYTRRSLTEQWSQQGFVLFREISDLARRLVVPKAVRARIDAVIGEIEKIPPTTPPE